MDLSSADPPERFDSPSRSTPPPLAAAEVDGAPPRASAIDAPSIWLLVAIGGGAALGAALAWGQGLFIQLGIAAAGALIGVGAWLVVRHIQVMAFLDALADDLDREVPLSSAARPKLWDTVVLAASIPWLLSNDNLLFDILQRVAAEPAVLPIRVQSALSKYARDQVDGAIDRSFKGLNDTVMKEERRVKHQSWLAMGAILIAMVSAGLGCCASFGYVASVPRPPEEPHFTFVRDVTLVSSWPSTLAIVSLAGMLLVVAGMALRTLERHHVRALSMAERLRFAGGLKASCRLDLHPFLEKFAPPSTVAMMRLLRNRENYDILSVSQLVAQPVQETASLRDVVPPISK